MEKQKRWQLLLIFAVVCLTIYNILPTLFYYSKPLSKPIDETRAQEISTSIVERVNSLEQDAVEWLASFCSLLNIKPSAIHFESAHPEKISLTFKSTADAARFRQYLPRAGALIPFVPSQLSLYPDAQEGSKTVVVSRQIPLHFDAAQKNTFFQFSPKFDAQGNISSLYRALVHDRALQIGSAIAGPSENALFVQAIAQNPEDSSSQELLLLLSQNIGTFAKTFGINHPLTERFFASFSQVDAESRSNLIPQFVSALEKYASQIKQEKTTLQQEEIKKQSQEQFLDTIQQQRLQLLSSREKTLSEALNIVKKNAQKFSSGKTPWTYANLGTLLQENAKKPNKLQSLSFDGRNPFIESLVIDWTNEKIYLRLYADVLAVRAEKASSSLQDKADQLLFNEMALVSRQTGETVSPFEGHFEISLSQLEGSSSFLALRLGSIARTKAEHVKQAILDHWNPKHPDLQRNVFPLWDYETYVTLSPEQQKLGLVFYAPATLNKTPSKGFRLSSLYVIAKGVDKILQKWQAASSSPEAQQFFADFQELQKLLQQNGFLGYSGKSYALAQEYANDFIFEEEEYYQTLLKATREDFTVHGTKRYATLEFSDVEQRLLTLNKIETRIQEDLLKWKDDYHAAQLGIKGVSPLDVPKPTKSPLWNNFLLSLKKYFRGDDRKVLHWGLDLSGGKTVQIELRDTNHRIVTNEVDLKQGINELYKRVNKMGVSEVNIRAEGHLITLDFPGSQGLSASELVKASSMYFHVVNEKFSPHNPLLADATQHFLQQVWNEAVVTNRKSMEDLNQIAWNHLYGESTDTEYVEPRSEAAKILYDNGLRLPHPEDPSISDAFNDTYSKIAIFRGDTFTDWQGQTHPLLIVFRNYALEGSSLENVHASYDPSKGNFLSFGIQGTYHRDALYAWTSAFSKEKIAGTPAALVSKDRGWRMAVILNGTVISAPTLDSALRDSAMISGSFSQREVNQLEADLKAGSLSFTPRILSEKNVSPELGSHERTLGILAMVIALVLVITVMVFYYRFAGVIASLSVLLNLLIMWAALQNIQATMTLASIAGIILMVGMAVDANVLVFERIREEFALTGRIASAVHAGYRKAFSAILDSNVTTIIAALILLHFDAGPVKAFAITLIIGIISSLFTALFVTRYFFAGWVQHPEHKTLRMCNLIKSTNFNFLKYAKPTLLLSALIVVIGSALFFAQRQTILGMDFTGGYSLSFELQKLPSDTYRNAVEKALLKQGAPAKDFQVRELSPNNHIQLFLSTSMDESGHPFYGMPIEAEVLNYPYEKNPKIAWVVQALKNSDLTLTPASLEQLESHWSEMSGQMSDTMRNNALVGLTIALLSILVYITVRFEFKYAMSATLCLAHDLIFTVAFIGILHACGVAIQIDLNTIAALLTICGYSLNDTIIVFDRIREEVTKKHKTSFSEMINHALNVTLGRTTMTSSTTLLVLLPLLLLGGSTIFGFALVMIIGVVFGTLSSWFIASPLMLYFHYREVEKNTLKAPTLLK